jgi:hypothetical protein
MSTYVHKAPSEPNDAIGLILIALIVALSSLGVYYCSVNSYEWGPAVIVPPQYEVANPGNDRSRVLPGHIPNGR